MELHLDLIGGLAGDMFIAALLDAFPEHEARVIHDIGAVDTGYPVQCTLLPHKDAVLTGRRFEIQLAANCEWVRTAKDGDPSAYPAAPLAPASPRHAHVTWRSIRAKLNDVHLSPGTRRHALAIFQLLANAEAFVHGVDPDSVEFHEVGAWDSVADIVGAAALIDAVGATHWSASPAPLGSGRIKTAHGMLPVPAPATTRLLLGMPTLDDGVGGERVTPTGAAILRYLCPPGSGRISFHSTRILTANGIGFGQRGLSELSNHVRVLCFEHKESTLDSRFIDVLEFDVDDQSGEDLAAGLDRLRAHDGVLDVTQSPVFGKKGRIMMHVCLQSRRPHLGQVVEACFRETTTIGLRHRAVRGIGLKRRVEQVEVNGALLRVKIVDRPGGATAKTESDDVLGLKDHARRSSLRKRAEQAALQTDSKIDA